METEKKITKNFKVTTTPELMKRLERFLALIHFNGKFGHSGLFGMGLDGDGAENIDVENIDIKLAAEVGLIGSVGYHIETAYDNSYGGTHIDFDKRNDYVTRNDDDHAFLLKKEDVIKKVKFKK